MEVSDYRIFKMKIHYSNVKIINKWQQNSKINAGRYSVPSDNH